METLACEATPRMSIFPALPLGERFIRAFSSTLPLLQ
jgi:hypothetical protein